MLSDPAKGCYWLLELARLSQPTGLSAALAALRSPAGRLKLPPRRGGRPQEGKPAAQLLITFEWSDWRCRQAWRPWRLSGPSPVSPGLAQHGMAQLGPLSCSPAAAAAAASRHCRQVWWIQSVFVVEERRRQGVYRALYTTVRPRDRAQGWWRQLRRAGAAAAILSRGSTAWHGTCRRR